MKKNIKYFVAAAVLSASVISCEKSEMVDVPAASINGSAISVELSGVSRAIENTQVELIANGFYLYIDQDGDVATSDGVGDQLVFMKKESGAWVAYDADRTAPLSEFVWTDYKAAKITALYAMNTSGEVASITASDMIEMVCSVPADQTLDGAALYADWLVASSLREGTVQLNDATGAITLDFEHLYSRISITVKQDGTTAVEALEVSLTNVPTTATARLAESATQLTAIEAAEEGVVMYFDAATTSYQAIVLPSSYAKGISVAVGTVGTMVVYTTIADLDGASDGAQNELLSGQDYEVVVPVEASFFVE